MESIVFAIRLQIKKFFMSIKSPPFGNRKTLLYVTCATEMKRPFLV